LTDLTQLCVGSEWKISNHVLSHGSAWDSSPDFLKSQSSPDSIFTSTPRKGKAILPAGWWQLARNTEAPLGLGYPSPSPVDHSSNDSELKARWLKLNELVAKMNTSKGRLNKGNRAILTQ